MSESQDMGEDDVGRSPNSLPATSETEPARLIRSEELFAGERIVLIQHAGEKYRLLITRNDRLILQK
jgi:hemin uptake protein HemP